MTAVTIPNPPTPEWLTIALRQADMLPTGQVTRVEESANAAFNSAARHLRLTYSPDAPLDMPTRLFFKRNLPAEWAVQSGACEVAFYQMAATMPNRLPMLVTCYGSAYDDESGDSWLLLRDVSATHRPPGIREQLIAGNGVPPDEQLVAIVEALAGLHAAWWEHPAFGDANLIINDMYCDQVAFEATLHQITDEWDTFLRTTGETLPASTRALCDAALAALPHLWDRLMAERMAARRQLTISHGDCYLSQFLCPLTESPDTATYLIDFQGACGDLPAVDLVFLFATFWTSEQRQEGMREERLLRAYLDALIRHGITNYTWDSLVNDYRLTLTFMLSFPIWDALNGSSRDYWEPKLRCLASAAEDWRCREFWADVMRPS